MKYTEEEKNWCLKNGKFYNSATKVEEQMKVTGRVDKKDRLTQTVKIMACNAMAFKVYGAGQWFSTFSVYQNHPRRFWKTYIPYMTFKCMYVIVLKQYRLLML